ncbi:MAG TPA: M15 family metallopeptidase [Puia sp.]|nr:M15 family metallopeptidase [Puia sp.]
MNNKILKEGLKWLIISVVRCLHFASVAAQNLPISTYGLPIINSDSIYHESVLSHPEKQMVSLEQIPGIIMDLRYATINNFMHKKLYPENTKNSFLRRPVYQALDAVARDLARQGLVLVIFDAYRPYAVTVELWIPVKDERYAANPAKGSGHNRGVAVDLTLADSKTHQRLPMPTDFDNFSDSARQDFNGKDAKRMANRELLKRVMEKYGFVPLPTEWWHFSWPHAENFEVLDLSFAELEKNK